MIRTEEPVPYLNETPFPLLQTQIKAQKLCRCSKNSTPSPYTRLLQPLNADDSRIPMPITVEEYQIGQLYTVIHASKEVTDGESAVEILENHPFEDPVLGSGQYTHKVYHIASRMPRLVQAIAPASALKVEEKAWNAYPRCKTVLSNPFLGDRFELTIDTIHLADSGTTENALGLDEAQLSERKIQLIDVGKDMLTGVEAPANEKYNVAEFVSTKTGRGPLRGEWIKNTTPIMCAYKLVSAKFQVFGLQTRVENFIENTQWSVFLKFHKEFFMLIDEWYGLSMGDIRQMERDLKAELDVKLDEFNLETRDQKLIKADGPAMAINKAAGHKASNCDALDCKASDRKVSEDLKSTSGLQQPSINSSSPTPVSNERNL